MFGLKIPSEAVVKWNLRNSLIIFAICWSYTAVRMVGHPITKQTVGIAPDTSPVEEGI
jgi:hypothetical protein